MKAGSLRNAVNNTSRRAFVSAGAAAIYSARVGVAGGEGMAGGQTQGEKINWLPISASVPMMTPLMRLYWPLPPALNGTWNPPQWRYSRIRRGREKSL